MHMQIHKPGNGCQSGGVDDLAAFGGLEIRGYLPDDAPGYENIRRSLLAGRGEQRVFYQNIIHGRNVKARKTSCALSICKINAYFASVKMKNKKIERAEERFGVPHPFQDTNALF